MDFLVWWAPRLGMTYKELNVWLFVIVHPAITLMLLVWLIVSQRRLKSLKSRSDQTS
ncbi:MAG: hypothetical protein ACKN9J_04740 [Holophagaceae bacterium]